MVNQFNAEYIDKEFGKIATRVKTEISIYLIGGCGMSFRGLKETTKDVDIVFEKHSDFEVFCGALFGAQYWEPSKVEQEYAQLHASKMFRNNDDFHLDLFVERVIKKLYLSKNMISRGELYKKYGNLSVYLLSKEDIFLFKGLASEGRERDLSDMRVIYPNLNWSVIKKELQTQKLSEELVEHFKRRLVKFREIYQLDVPILNKI